MPLMKFGKIKKGQYEVTVNLNDGKIDVKQIKKIKKSIRLIDNKGAIVKINCKTKCLTYTSETLLPPAKNIDAKKKKLLFVLGNPAIHSVEKGMFFFSDKNGDRHGFWGKLAKTCLLKNFELKTRKEEAEKRRNLILSGNTNCEFVIGFTTFYSLPTPTGVKGNRYCDSKGVENLFGPQSQLLERIKEDEFKRIIKGIKNQPEVSSFAKKAILITTIKSAKNYLRNKINDDRVKYWPIRGGGSGWKNLNNILNKL